MGLWNALETLKVVMTTMHPRMEKTEVARSMVLKISVSVGPPEGAAAFVMSALECSGDGKEGYGVVCVSCSVDAGS